MMSGTAFCSVKRLPPQANEYPGTGRITRALTRLALPGRPTGRYQGF